MVVVVVVVDGGIAAVLGARWRLGLAAVGPAAHGSAPTTAPRDCD